MKDLRKRLFDFIISKAKGVSKDLIELRHSVMEDLGWNQIARPVPSDEKMEEVFDDPKVKAFEVLGVLDGVYYVKEVEYSKVDPNADWEIDKHEIMEWSDSHKRRLELMTHKNNRFTKNQIELPDWDDPATEDELRGTIWDWGIIKPDEDE